LYQHGHSMSRWHQIQILAITAALITAIVAFAAPASASSGHYDPEPIGTFRVTVENLTENQTLTPAIVAAHGRGFRLFQNHRPASNGVQQLAENGGVPALLDELNGSAGVYGAVATEGGPIAPGTSASTLITTAGDANRISVAAMLICTNDGFAGVDGARVSPRTRQTTRNGQAYDAGTEVNTQDFDDLVPPCAAMSGVDAGTGTSNPGLSENGVVRRHRGISEVGDLSPAANGWRGPVIKVTIERVATYEITITNLTSGQPITPAVFAAHSGRHDLFRRGAAASSGIQQLAENGGVGVLAAEAAANPSISASTVVGEVPLAPGVGASVSLDVVGRANRFSLASMLVCTNDGFGGVDGDRLPTRIGSERMYQARAFDAGTETNTELFADLVPPCDGDLNTGTGTSNPALAEGSSIQRHTGIQAVGDLTAAHDWSGPVVEITIERTG
jgi:hypothetical protein